MAKNPPANAGDTGDVGSIPGPGKCLGNGNPPQYSGLENSMDRGPRGSQWDFKESERLSD